MIVSSIDFSMSSPGICQIDTNKEFCFDNVKKFYLNSIKKHEKDWPSLNAYGSFLPKFESNIERFDFITDWVISIVKGSDIVTIEDYSFNSKGVVFNIGEITGILKYKLWKNNLKFFPVGITLIKKSFSGKGNASKGDMFDAFYKKTNINLYEEFGLTGNQLSPAADIIDSYGQLEYICSNLEKF